MLYNISFQQADDSPCGLDEVSEHIEEGHVAKDCRWPLETARCLQPTAKNWSLQFYGPRKLTADNLNKLGNRISPSSPSK